MMLSLLHQYPSLLAVTAALVLPLLAFGLIMIFTRAHPRLSAAISICAVSASLAAALYLLLRPWSQPAAHLYQTTWMVSGSMHLPLGVLLDPLSVLMLVIVAAISLLVQIYSLGYMAGDPGFGRYYGCISLFAWAMLTLTVSSSLLQLYIFWELVGLASYLLIGFWYEKNTASQAGKKAFVMTRFGDVAFLIGLVLLWLQLEDLGIEQLSDPQRVAARLSPGMITLTALLIFGGIVGKSAQFPLFTWLPDAMEGPTPVSALLHSATMVAAGVYLFARLFAFFSLSPVAMSVCLAIGTISMLLAASMAMVSRDIKQVWAYSTISQLGFMLMGLGSGGFYAGVFHLTTHAGFKALLFLCSGVLIHHFGTNDMVVIGRQNGRGLKNALICMTLAAATLSGVPPLSGFFSKELVLGSLADLHTPIWVVAGLVGTFLTPYYTFRLIFILWFPSERAPSGTSHGHGSQRTSVAMTVPLWTLAVAVVGLGLVQDPLVNFLGGATGAATPAAKAPHAWLPVAALILVAAAIATAWVEFGRKGSRQMGFVERWPAVAALFGQRWYLDHLYRWLLDRLVYQGLSRLFVWNDRQVIDGGVDGIGGGTVGLGRIVARLHTGMIQSRLMVMFAVVVVLLLYFGFGG